MLGSLYKSVSEGIIVLDKKGMILFTNYTAEAIFGLKGGMVLGKRFLECLDSAPENDSFRDAVTDVVFSSEKTVSGKVSYQCGGRRYLLLLRSVYMVTEQFRGFILVFSDISELEQLGKAELALENKKKKNEELSARNRILDEAFRQHLDDDVAEELLNTPAGIGFGVVRREMTLLMAFNPDLQKYVTAMPASDYLEMVNRYYDRVISAVKENRGTILEMHCDQILAGFGALKDSEHHADDALKAADQLQRSMAELNAQNAKKSFPQLGIKAGLHTAEYPVGVFGGGDVLRYDVNGRNVIFLARITISANLSDIVAGDAVLQHLKESFEILDQYEIIPKGMDERVKVYKVRRA